MNQTEFCTNIRGCQEGEHEVPRKSWPLCSANPLLLPCVLMEEICHTELSGFSETRHTSSTADPPDHSSETTHTLVPLGSCIHWSAKVEKTASTI